MGGEEGAEALRKGWERFFRWGPYGLLGLSTLMAVATSAELMTPGENVAAASLLGAALLLHLWWGRAMRASPGAGSPKAVTYYCVRTLSAITLTLLNPFFSIYAVLGYFDSGHWLPKRWVRLGLLVNAGAMAGAEAGGLPPTSMESWTAFGVLYLLNAALVLFFARLGEQEADNVRANEATIAELERANSRLAQALEENAGLHAQLLVQAREAGVSDERRRLAAEIHDTIAQGLAGIIAQLQVASGKAGPEACAPIDLAAGLARQSLAQARRSVQNLAPSELEHDALPTALEKTTSEWSRSSGVHAGFTLTGTPEPLHSEVEATLLRIAQEALTNVDRHAGATRAGVTLSYMGDEVTLDVRDDGRGFDPHCPPSRPTRGGGGFGLGGMRSRAERLAGRVDIETEPGGGTAVSARVPLVRHD
ncbi:MULTISPECIES: sensor histidine kinase [unclassified Streptomyces]|uniref:sensor histidine kinase n=1 Tax=unclassified Streptomyces TaxID=2593676 RepID=UPI002DD9CCF8|nr:MULTISPECIES: sensor histidine kinase [unclassified Streptomyces]WSB76677.1 sensor histidine kinase [Streptomyces sp. NBC_01775]WSS15036.1 sensor histidine kinase [Streptomyces sp. NBC_01186]WSS43879.1 sensor histidine kinase [Streptomyces sp. NBC_01187]